MLPPSELVVAAHAHANERTRKGQRHPQPAVQAAGGDAAEHGTDVATKSQARAVAHDETGRQSNNPLLRGQGLAAGRGLRRDPQGATQNADVGDTGDVHEHSLRQALCIAGLAPESMGSRLKRAQRNRNLGGPQAKAINHAPRLSGPLGPAGDLCVCSR